MRGLAEPAVSHPDKAVKRFTDAGWITADDPLCVYQRLRQNRYSRPHR